jgi:hypothetical protein
MTMPSLFGEAHGIISFSRQPEAYLSIVNKSNLLTEAGRPRGE